MKRLCYFAVVCVLLFGGHPQGGLIERIVTFVGTVAAVLTIVCPEQYLPDKVAVRLLYMVRYYVLALWFLVTDPKWVAERRSGLVAMCRRDLERSIRKAEKLGLSFDAKNTEVTRVMRARTKDLHSQTRKLRKICQEARYPQAVYLAIRIHRLSLRAIPAHQMAHTITEGIMATRMMNRFADTDDR